MSLLWGFSFVSAFQKGAPLSIHFPSNFPTSDWWYLSLAMGMVFRAFSGDPDHRMGKVFSFGFGNSL